jgi:hypothetical protein
MSSSVIKLPEHSVTREQLQDAANALVLPSRNYILDSLYSMTSEQNMLALCAIIGNDLLYLAVQLCMVSGASEADLREQVGDAVRRMRDMVQQAENIGSLERKTMH